VQRGGKKFAIPQPSTAERFDIGIKLINALSAKALKRYEFLALSASACAVCVYTNNQEAMHDSCVSAWRGMAC
jgi:hypothetical protein